MNRSGFDCSTLHQFAHSSAACFPVLKTSQAEDCGGFVLTLQNSTKCQPGASYPGLLEVRRTPYAIHPQYVLINALELLSACRSLFVPLKLVHLHRSRWLCWTCEQDCDVVVGSRADCCVGTARRAACLKHNLTSSQDCCRFESVAPRKLYRVVVISLFLAVFYITLAFR